LSSQIVHVRLLRVL